MTLRPHAATSNPPMPALALLPRRRRELPRNSLFDSRFVPLLLVAGCILFLLVFVGYPIFYNIIMSFQDVRLGNIRNLSRPFVGIANYHAILDDPIFLEVTGNTIVFVASSVVLQVGFGLLLALFFNLDFPGAGWMRGTVLAGWILPPLVIAGIFRWLFSTNGGVVNEILRFAGLVGRPISFLPSPETAMPVVVLTNVRIGAPFAMILMSAALFELPKELYEAAALDCASARQRFLNITWPLMRPTIYAVLSLCTIYALRTFDVIWGLTAGGPVDATTTFAIWSYKLSFGGFHFGQGAVIAALMFVCILFAALFYNRSLRAEVRV